jgi:hypothetical protein
LIASIRDALTPLCGLPLWGAGRAADLLWLQLGARVQAPTSKQPDRVTGEYALHIQCPWRASSAAGIIVGSGDLFRSTDGSELESDEPGASLADALLQRWLADHSLSVTAVAVDKCGGFTLRLTNGFSFETFPDAAPSRSSREHWRLLSPGRSVPHFVLLDTGLETHLAP